MPLKAGSSAGYRFIWQCQAQRKPETPENQGFLAKEKHRNPDTHCIKIAVLICSD